MDLFTKNKKRRISIKQELPVACRLCNDNCYVYDNNNIDKIRCPLCKSSTLSIKDNSNRKKKLILTLCKCNVLTATKASKSQFKYITFENNINMTLKEFYQKMNYKINIGKYDQINLNGFNYDLLESLKLISGETFNIEINIETYAVSVQKLNDNMRKLITPWKDTSNLINLNHNLSYIKPDTFIHHMVKWGMFVGSFGENIANIMDEVFNIIFEKTRKL